MVVEDGMVMWQIVLSLEVADMTRVSWRRSEVKSFSGKDSQRRR